VSDPLPTEPYGQRALGWPTSGRHLMACYDDTTIVVYQAYRPEIADYAVGRSNSVCGVRRCVATRRTGRCRFST
jgi:hypothetical protein